MAKYNKISTKKRAVKIVIIVAASFGLAILASFMVLGASSHYHDTEYLTPAPHAEGPASSTLPLSHSIARTLVVYVYYEKDPSYVENLRFLLRNGVAYSPLVDFVFVVNGNSSVKFPDYPNLRVYQRSNECFDVGGWAFGLKQAEKDGSKYAFFIFLNSSVRGPFSVRYTGSTDTVSWTKSLTNRLRHRVKLVGPTINCPDGVGRKIPHVQTMAWATDFVGLGVIISAGVFKCHEDKKSTLYAEGDISKAILESGYELEALQVKYANIQWRYKYMSDDACKGVSLDVFAKDNWYDGMTINPLEVLFFKTNRGVGADMLRLYTEWMGRKPSALLVSHNLNLEGAPIYLYNLAKILVAEGWNVEVWSPQNGILSDRFQQLGVSQRICGDIFESVESCASLASLRTFDVIVLNTIVASPLLALFKPHNVPPIIWIIHESDRANYENQSNLSLGKAANIFSVPQTIIFVSNATQQVYADRVGSNFCIIHGWLEEKRVYLPSETERLKVREVLGFSSDDFIIVVIGTICERKQQLQLVEAFHQFLVNSPLDRKKSLKLVIVGAADPPEMELAKVENYLRKKSLSSSVRIFNKTVGVDQFLFAANLLWSNSKSESFPLNVLEAMGLGVPVVSTNVFGVVEMVPENGGWLYKPTQDLFPVLSEILTDVLSDELNAKQNGLRGQAFVRAHFSESVARTKWLRTLRDYLV